MLQFQDGDVLIKIRFGRRNVFADERQIDALRVSVNDSGNLTTSLKRFVTRAMLANELPATFLMHRSGVLYAAILLRFRRHRGIPSGVVSAGDGTGEGSIISDIADRIPALETASRVLMRFPFIHTVLLAALWPESVLPNTDQPVGRHGGRWQLRDVSFRLDLTGGREATMERLGYKMRRNLGYYRRRAEDKLGCHFLADLQSSQRRHAVEALFDKGTYRLGLKKALLLDAMLGSMPGQFAMGLQDGQGEWLSYIAGWRSSDGTYIDWQLNREHPVNASMSTVIRSYLLDGELERGSPAIVFVGGTAPHWSRVCVPAVCGDLFVVRKGLMGKMSQHLVRRFRPSGRLAKLQDEAAP